ncbi:LemA family protein [Reinekea sp.]|jgi:LemA protein|uniref:LemA family protein n=1 Tax=Reinekea sp. TaxID=1970455 RepID=UPI002A7F00CB|nr:LemA family protein [Reinekea sp.]
MDLPVGVIITWAVPLVLIVFLISIYNKLVAYRNRFKNAFSQIDVQLQRRHDLIPNLVETAKTYLKHEKETLENVTAARNQAVSAQKAAAADPTDGALVGKLSQAEGMLSGALGRLFAVSEDYPDLKADGTMRDLMESLESTENKVSFARQAFNDAVMHYQTLKESFPNNLVANVAGFKDTAMFEVDSAEVKRAPEVSF